MNLAALIAIVKEIDQKTFVERFPHPMLVVRKGGGDAEVPFQKELDVKTTQAKAKASPFATSSGLPRAPRLSVSSIEPLVKTNRNPFAGMITVGRATNNDVCLPVPSVSKLHAYFQEQGKKWTVRDGTSSNGTFVDGQKLAPEKPQELADGSHVAFGPDTECLFRMPAGLFLFLKSIAK